MDRSSITSLNDGKWTFDEYKVIKVIGAAKDRIAFQRKGKYTRGVSISKDAFMKMEDVTLTPGMEMILEDHLHLKNAGKSIYLIKYCKTRDNKQCEGGFFSFTPKEWMVFWTKLRKPIIDYLQK